MTSPKPISDNKIKLALKELSLQADESGYEIIYIVQPKRKHLFKKWIKKAIRFLIGEKIKK